MNDLKTHIYEYDEINIGLNISSLIHSYFTGNPILYKINSKPRFFEFIDYSMNLSRIGMDKENKQLNFPKGKFVKPYSKKSVYNHLYYIQSLSGKIPLAENVTEFYLDEESQILKVVSKNQRIYKFKFNKLRIFDTREIKFLTPTGERKEHLYVLDEFNTKFIDNKFYHIIPAEGLFPRNIYLSTDKKRLMSHSELTMEELRNPEYSSFYIGKQVNKILLENKLRIKLEWVKRHIQDKDLNEYETSSSIIIDKRTEDEVWKDCREFTQTTWLGSFQYRMVHQMMDSRGRVLSLL